MRGDFRLDFKFKAATPNFTDLTFGTGIIIGHDVFLGQLVNRCRDRNPSIIRGIFDAAFILFGLDRIKCIAITVRTRCRFKRCAVTGKWRNAIVKVVNDTGTPGQGMVALFFGGVGFAFGNRTFSPVVTQSQYNIQTINLDLVLQVKTGLRRFCFLVGAVRKRHITDIARQITPVLVTKIVVPVIFFIELIFVIQTTEHLVFDDAGVEIEFGLVINDILIKVVIGMGRKTVDLGAAGLNRVQDNLIKRAFDVVIARILTQGYDVIDRIFKAVAK